jgi:uncharacterized protein (DUF488 family)
MQRVLTAGHGTANREELAGLFVRASIDRVVDVRRFPGSRRNPDVASDAMSQWLPEAGVAYRWDPRLGGRRQLPTGHDPGVDGWWQVPAFRAFASHMRTDEFHEGMTELLVDAESATTVIMCSETLWWRCHRRLIADALTLLHHVPVRHLGHDNRLTEHKPSPGARVTPSGLRYDEP